MARKKYVKKRKGNTKKGRGIPYIYKNRIYFGKKPEKLLRVFQRTLEALLVFNG